MKKTVLMLAGCLGFTALAAGTAHVTVDFDRPNGTIRAINGGNLGPDFHAGRLRGDGVLLVANTSKDAVPFRLDLGRLNAVSCILTDDAHTYEEAGVPDALPPHSFLLLKVGAAQP